MLDMTRTGRSAEELFAPSRMDRQECAHGGTILKSPQPLGPYDRCVGDWLAHWARIAPDRDFLLERGSAVRWERITYGQAHDLIRRIGSWLLAQQLSAERPLCILSDNGIEHALLALAAMHVGVAAVPVSPAYSLMSRQFDKLRAIVGLIRPGAIFVDDELRFIAALNAIRDLDHGVLITGTRSAGAGRDAIPFRSLIAASANAQVDRAFAALGGDTIAKILFTSGSTGEPKGVINTQRMLCSNQQAIRQIWPFLQRDPPVIVDWLPWNHTFGGNFTFNLVLRNGGTLYIDGGRPLAGMFDSTLMNLEEIAPTIHFNVPRGYDMLAGALRERATLRNNFFARLQLIFYAAASLPVHLWQALNELSQATLGERVAMVSGWGSTETAPLATTCQYQAEQPGVIGVAIPGCELKLVAGAGKQEVRVRGPNVTPGYWKQPALTAASFDEEGYYRIGDAVRFVDAARPDLGLIFDGRIVEDFKLSSGTWVNVGVLRAKALAALAPVAQDIVIAGHDRHEIAFLIFPNVAACRGLCGLAESAALEQILAHPTVRRYVQTGLANLRLEGGGSSTYATRALLLTQQPSIDGGEISDKGYINQRAVLTQRRDLVELLYASPADARLLTPDP